MIQFIFPAAFLLLIPIAVLFYFWRTQNQISYFIRIIIAVLLIVAIAQPELLIKKLSGVVVVLADRSASMPKDSAERQTEIIQLLQKGRAGDARLAVIGFDRDIYIEKAPDLTPFVQFQGIYNNDGSSITRAIMAAQSIIPQDRHGRILLLSDGRATGVNPIDHAARENTQTPIDYRFIHRPIENDIFIKEISLPDYVNQGETFQFSVTVISPHPTTMNYKLYRSRKLIKNGSKAISPGTNMIYFRDRLLNTGKQIYRFEIADTQYKDSITDNNKAKGVLAVMGLKSLLHIGNQKSNLIKLAQKGNIKVFNQKPANMDWSLSELSKYKAIILENVAASAIGFQGLSNINHFVRHGGGSLLITGGRKSFGRGGYYKSPLEQVMPVTMELRKQHQKLLNAVVIALDRSGSMGVPVTNRLTKMDLANRGAASVLELLTAREQFGLIAVDTKPMVIVPFDQVGANKNMKLERIHAINSSGGGIFVYAALIKAVDMIYKAKAAARHIILFSDASDSEEPGQYKDLIKKMRQAGITISVIGLGTDKDQDAKLLKDIAARGSGQIYFTKNPRELPLLFTQDAMTMFKGTFIEDSTPVKLTDAIKLLMTVPESSPLPVGGYNVVYPKTGASVPLITADEEKMSLLTFWQAGSGRCMTFAAEVDGKYTGAFGKWQGNGDFYLSILRWLNSDSQQGQLYAYTEKKDETVVAKVELDPARKANPFSSLPVLIQLIEKTGELQLKTIPFHFQDRNTLTANTPITGNGINHFFIKADDQTVHSAAYTLPYSIEFKKRKSKRRSSKLLRRLSEFTGGKERQQLDKIYNDIPETRQYFRLANYLALVILFLLLVDIYHRRIGLFSIVLFSRKSWHQVKSVSVKVKKPVQEKLSAKTASVKEEEAKANETESVLDAIKSISKRK